MRKTTVALGVVALCVAVLVTWAIPRQLSDLYMALAGGRDVLAGKLVKPDDWSYTTPGRVWVNSSWGSDVVLVLVRRAAGDVGLLALKAALLAGLGLLVARVARAHGASPAASLTAAALALTASPQDLILRPNLISLLFAPLLLLLLATRENRVFWLVEIGVLFLLWTNMHGAFVFGLLLLGIWLVTNSSRIRPRWVGPAALALPLLIALFANPFGPKNLWFQLMPQSTAWKNVVEWAPLLRPTSRGVAFPILFVVVVAIAILGQLRLLARRDWNRREHLFELIVVMLGTVLSLKARRLVPWTAVAMAPAVARGFDDLAPARWRAVALAAAQLALVVFLIVANRWLPAHYSKSNPVFPNESVFERMVLTHTFPVGAAEFLERNQVKERVFNEWGWEGYLHEYAPGLKLFIGGRAHQVYDEATYWKYRAFLGGGASRSDLQKLGVSIAVIPLFPEYVIFCRGLVGGPGAWSYVYADRYTAVFADPEAASTRELVGRAAAGQLTYPDSASAALSRAMCLSSPATADPAQALALLQRALALRPTGYAYPVLVRAAIQTEVPRDKLLAYLEQEDGRLERMSRGAAEENALLDCRLYILQELERLYPAEATVKKQHLAAERVPIERRMQAIANSYPSYFR